MNEQEIVNGISEVFSNGALNVFLRAIIVRLTPDFMRDLINTCILGSRKNGSSKHDVRIM